jgi:CheY-like chemotaxis protein
VTENLLRLLLVEDKKHDYALAKRSLEKSHLTCEIVWVQKGDEALKLLHAQAFDVVTLDYIICRI